MQLALEAAEAGAQTLTQRWVEHPVVAEREAWTYQAWSGQRLHASIRSVERPDCEHELDLGSAAKLRTHSCTRSAVLPRDLGPVAAELLAVLASYYLLDLVVSPPSPPTPEGAP
jgi:hypothetical protein